MIVWVCMLLIALSAILSCVASVGVSLDNTNKYPWVDANGAYVAANNIGLNIDFYSGLVGKMVVWRHYNATSGQDLRAPDFVLTKWTDHVLCTQHSCGPCEASSIASATFVLMSIAFTVPTFLINWKRSYPSWDGNVEKFISVCCLSLCIFCSMFSLLIYLFHCVAEMPKKMGFVVQGKSVIIRFYYSMGLGALCMLTSVLFQIAALIANVCIQVPLSDEEIGLLEAARREALEAAENAAEAERAAEEAEMLAEQDRLDKKKRGNTSYEDSFLSNPEMIVDFPKEADEEDVMKRTESIVDNDIAFDTGHEVPADLQAEGVTQDPPGAKIKSDAAMTAIKASAARRKKKNEDEMSQMSNMSQQSDLL